MRVNIGGCGMEVDDHGEGVPVILLHGFPLSSEIWAPIRPAVEQVARLVTPDLRGFGRSDKPADGYGMDALAGDVAGIADALGVERLVLGGHSMGGYVALRFAARWPERLLGLILVDTRAEADGEAARARRDAAIATIHERGGAAFLDAFVPNLLGPTTRARAPRFLSDLRAIAAEAPDHALVACLVGMRDRPDSTALLPALDLPTLVLVGQEDTITPPAVAQPMAEALRRATLAVIPGAGHTPSVERPILTADAVIAFLRGLADEPRRAPSR